MSKELEDRIASLKHEIAAADGKMRVELIEHLEQVVLGLEGIGATIPAWAHELLENAHEEEVEDGFDNMPV